MILWLICYNISYTCCNESDKKKFILSYFTIVVKKTFSLKTKKHYEQAINLQYYHERH